MPGRIRSNILWAFLAVSALDGILSGLLGDSGFSAGPRELALTLIELALVFAWIHYDSMERKFRRSALFNIGIAAAAVVFVPLYLYKSREPAQRLPAIVGLMVFVVTALGVEAGAEWAVKFMAM